MVASAIVLALGLLAERPAAPTTAPAKVAATQCPDVATATVDLGPADAPTRLHAFLDPAATGAHGMYADLRRVVGERAGDVAISIWLVRPLSTFDPRLDRVRRFAWAAARLGRLREALILIARQGPEWVATSLLDESRVRVLAKRLDVDPTALVRAVGDRCDRDRLELASIHLGTLGRKATLGLVRLPAFSIGEFVFDDAPALDRLRPELARDRVRRTLRWRPSTVPMTQLGPTSNGRSGTVDRGGMLLGGLGLPHSLVLRSASEDDVVLFLSLARALSYRASHPGQLSVRIDARGDGFAARLLRGRLCAATRLGRELEYARVLAQVPDARRAVEPRDDALLADLDATAKTHCDDLGDPTDVATNDGAWLDDVPRAPAEFEDLESLLRQDDASRHPLDPFFGPNDRLSDRPE